MFKNKQLRFKKGIQFKLSIGILLILLFVMGVGVYFGYSWAIGLFRQTVVGENIKIAELLQLSIRRIISEELGDIEFYASFEGSLRDSLLQQNESYASMSAKQRQEYFIAKDEEWAAASGSDSLRTQVLLKRGSVHLERLLRFDRSIAEVIITDRYGGLCAASGLTSDFYQADEPWWDNAFDGGRGRIIIEDITFDESTQHWGIPVALPIRDEGHEVIGVVKALILAKRFIAPLETFRIGSTGHAVLVNDKNKILFDPDPDNFKNSFCRAEDFARVLSLQPKGFFVGRDVHGHKESTLVAFSLVDDPLLIGNGVRWFLCVGQSTEEVFAPVKNLLNQGYKLTFLLLVIIVPLVFMFGGYFVGPAVKLQKAMGRVAQGNFDYKLDIRTGDEVEELASAFNTMIDNLKKITIRRDDLDKEVAERKKTQEEILRINEDLIKNETALKNILYDLKQSHDELQYLLRSMTEAFAIFDSVFDDKGNFISYRFVYINEAFEYVAGVRNDEVKGKKVQEVWPETEQDWIDNYAEVALTGKPKTFDMYHGPTKKMYHCNAYRPWASQERFCVILEDITEHERLEAEIKDRLRELEIFYKASIGREEHILTLKKKIVALEEALKQAQGPQQT